MLTNTATTQPGLAVSLAAARLSIAAVVAYHALLIVLLFIRPDLDPSWQTISVYAIGRHGWIMSGAFFVSALSYGALFVALVSQARGLLGRVGLGLLLLSAVGTVGAGVFVTDPIETPQNALSTTGTLHVVSAGGALLLLPFAALAINLSLARKSPVSRPARLALLWTAGLPALGLVAFGVAMAVTVPVDEENVPQYGPGVNIGWPNRVLLGVYMVWLIVVAAQVVRTARAPRSVDAAAVGQ